MDIVEKIKKLLALSESPDANEAALAAQRAQELMIKYAIEESQIKPEERKVEAIQTFTCDMGTFKLANWKALLAYILAPNFFCRSFFQRGGKNGHAIIYFVGTKSDFEVAWATYVALSAEVERMAQVAFDKLPGNFGIHGKTWKTAFYDGVCYTINERLSKNLAQLSADNAGTAIVVANKGKAVDDFVNENHNIKKNNSSRKVVASGYVAGQQAGHALDLGARSTKSLNA
jgi:hypothetical protein